MTRSNLEDNESRRMRLWNPRFSVGVLADAEVTLTFAHPTMLTMTPTAARDINLPDDDDATYEGSFFIIRNGAAATHDITIKDEADATLGTISPTEMALIVLDVGGVWRVGVMPTT